MDNQVNPDDQNAQQIGQNPINQPVLAPEKSKTNYLLIGGVVLACFVVFGIGGYFLGKQSSMKPDNRIVENFLSPTNSPVVNQDISPTITSNSNAYLGNGFQVELTKGWSNLTNNCQQINITKSDAIELELSIGEYVRRDMNISDVSTYNDIISSVNKENKYLINFINVSKENVVIIGPQGEGELNNVYVRGPEGTGYYRIVVLYNGPVPDVDKICLGSKSEEYKQILSTFKFIK